MDTQNTSNLSELTADIVSAYVSNNNVRAEDLATLISEVHSALKKAPNGKAEPAPEPQEPAVPIKKSVTPDYIISLESGQKFKSLKRHLMNSYGMTPDEYRAKDMRRINRSDWRLIAGGWSSSIQDGTHRPVCRGCSSRHR